MNNIFLKKIFKFAVIFITVFYFFGQIIYPSALTQSLKVKNRISNQTISANSLSVPIMNDSDSTYLKNFATHYYTHLHNNMAYNKMGSCGYVAISSLLSFYDCFWNDNIIPEQYDNKSTSVEVSPGVKVEGIFASLSDKEYMTTIYNQENINKYFQFLLFSLAREYNLTSYDQANLTMNFGVSYQLVINVINTYLYSYLGLDNTEYELITIANSGNGGENVKEFIKEYVSDGYPVIVGIPGHVTLAYDYDLENDTVYGFWGYGESGNHNSYTDFSDAYAIKLNMPHVHSNNYVLDGIDTCACKLPTHVHDYTYKYSKYNNVEHKCECYLVLY